ncbi:MAG: YceH family protein [Burkholderiales bacterium]|nr:YceH family protein [Burkholderiales bacterium]MDE2277692.1 YceH family protein [Burkholderiales bacterium]
MRPLSPLEARVLGVLIEKQATVPDTYPLSLNAIVAGCNQKTARMPVIEASDAEVLTAVDGLKALSLVFEGSGSRVVKFEHNTARVLHLPSQAVALLAVLMLRGPQTAAELRLNSERLHRFADISSVEGFLDELAAKTPAMVIKLPRAPGEREARWAQLLCGEVAPPAARTATPSVGDDAVSAGEIAALRAEQTRLADEVSALKALVHRLARELGVTVTAEDGDAL